MSDRPNIDLGYELGTGEPVAVPLAHTFVTGQTQLSGKTTTLRALVSRSGRRALAFVTKRGESFDGRRIPPYLPREGEQPIHWRLVETILASALGQRTMKTRPWRPWESMNDAWPLYVELFDLGAEPTILPILGRYVKAAKAPWRILGNVAATVIADGDTAEHAICRAWLLMRLKL